MHTKRATWLLLPLLAALLLAGGCYYTHLASGQTRLLMGRRSVESLRLDPTTPAGLRERLNLVARVRAFAAELGLEVGAQYTSFVDTPDRGVVTSVVATRPGELEAAGFWFPVLGRLPYKGFFDAAQAEREAERLRARGLDVCVSPIVAYSTLGWFDDPLTGPMLRLDPELLVETVLHELVHATVFVENEPAFNEGLANFVGQEAAVRFYAREAASGGPSPQQVRLRVEDERRIAERLARYRADVEALYTALPAGPERDAARVGLEHAARESLAALPLARLDATAVARTARLGDACQALARAYEENLSGYAVRLSELGDDLPAFLAAARRAAADAEPRAGLGLAPRAAR